MKKKKGNGKYHRWISKEGLLKIEGWARDGLTNEQIAHNIGITVSTLYDWQIKYSELLDALKRGKEVVDREVENALLKKALGFREVVKKPMKVKTIEYDNGRKVLETEEIIYANEEIYVAPDTTAQIFWLKNRKPEDWRDKKDVSVSIDKKLEDFFSE